MPQLLSATKEEQAPPDEKEQNVFALFTNPEKIIQASLPQEVKTEINEYLANIFANNDVPPRLALRSSALDEDEPGTFFAGQYRSELNVEREEIEQTYKEVVARKFQVPAVFGLQGMMSFFSGNSQPAPEYGNGLGLYQPQLFHGFQKLL